ncbi:MAG TPA: hypothetical protein VNO82_17490 [Solirubrobacteraceae bacterium]|nr:hypothetical protein [Solirubrobacteraceae bacterium]
MRFQRRPQAILELLEAWSDGPPPRLPNGPVEYAELDGDVEQARRVLREATHPEPVKRAIAVLRGTGDERDAEVLETLARHDEFSLAAGTALASVLGDPVTAWWRVSCVTTGWGKVEAVGRLTAQRDLHAEARAWLLRQGCAEVVMPEYVAHAVATAGRLEDALDGLVDDALLDGACVILSALVNGGPAEDIDDYEPGPRVATAVLDLLGDRAPTIVRMRAVAHLLTWAEDYEEHVPIAERCGRLLTREESRRFVAERLGRRDEVLPVWGVAEAMGLDAWEAGWRHLQSSPHDPRLYHHLGRSRRPDRRARLIAFAEQALPLAALASGPEERRFPDLVDRDAALTLDSLVQRMRTGQWSEALVAAALQSPVISTRNGALAALAAASPEDWGEAVLTALRRLAAGEPAPELRAQAEAQLARLAGS